MIEPIRNEDASLPLADLNQILAICDQFEADWKAGRPHCINDDMGKVPELLQDRLLCELQALELELKHTGNRRIGPGFNEGVERVHADGEFVETSVRAARNFMPAVAPGDPPSSTNWKYLGAERTGVSDEGVSLSYLVVRQSGEIAPLLGPEHHRLLEEIFRPGVLIQGRYPIRREVGKGGMGQVYLAWDSRLNRPVAIKVSLHLGEDRGLNQTQIDEFQQAIAEEARLGLNLVHPAIATVYDYGFHDDKPFTVFEYLHGQTLGKLRRSRGRLTLEEVRPIIGPLAQALDFAHGRYVVHRDLKPENIRATGQGLFKVLDLGLAKEFQRNADWSGFAGTPAYASPEQSSGAACDGRTDQYALALIVFELLAGRRLFESRDPLVLLELHRDAPPTGIEDALPDVPGSIREALSRALSKDPNDRFATCSDFAGALGCQLLKTVLAPEILLETDVERMTAGRLVRWVGFAEKNAVHLVLTREALWSVYRTEFRRWPLIAIERVKLPSGCGKEWEPAEPVTEVLHRTHGDYEAIELLIHRLNVVVLVVFLALLVSWAVWGDPSEATISIMAALGGYFIAVPSQLRLHQPGRLRAGFYAAIVLLGLACGVLLAASGVLVALALNSEPPEVFLLSTLLDSVLGLGTILDLILLLAAYVAWPLLSWKKSQWHKSFYKKRTWPRGQATRRALRLTLRMPDGGLMKLAFKFSTDSECEHWAGRLAKLAGQLGDPAALGSEGAPAKLEAWCLPWPHDDDAILGIEAAPARLPPVVLLRERPTTRYQLIGTVEAKADKRWRAEASLQVRAAMMGADAVIDVQQKCLPKFHRTVLRLSGTAVKAADLDSRFEPRSRWYTEHLKQIGKLALAVIDVRKKRLPDSHRAVHRLSGTAVKAVDPESLFELRSHWYNERLKQIGNLALGFVVISLLARIAWYWVEADRQGMVTDGYGLPRDAVRAWSQMALFITVIHIVPLGMVGLVRMLRWPQLVCPMAVTIGALSLRPVYFLVGIGAIGTGPWLGRGFLFLLLDPISLALLLFGWFPARAAWSAHEDFQSFAPREGQRSSAPRAVVGVMAWVVAIGFAVAFAGWCVLGLF